jgi:putative FmdB family regulatory protein
MPMMYDFRCDDCENDFEDLVSSSEVSDTICPACGSQAQRRISAVNLGFTNDPNVQREALKKRSENHTKNMMKKNPEKLAKAFGGTAEPKAQSPWNVRSKAKK